MSRFSECDCAPHHAQATLPPTCCWCTRSRPSSVPQVRLVQTVAALLYYNAELTLATLAQGGEGAVRLWMETTVQSLPAHTMMIDKKITALGLTAVLAVPPERLPPPLRVRCAP